jgi:hypothetical protein
VPRDDRGSGWTGADRPEAETVGAVESLSAYRAGPSFQGGRESDLTRQTLWCPSYHPQWNFLMVRLLAMPGTRGCHTGCGSFLSTRPNNIPTRRYVL